MEELVRATGEVVAEEVSTVGVEEALVTFDGVVAGEFCLLNIKAGERCLATGGGSAIGNSGRSSCKRGGKSSGPI